jgi:hypothetical protein
MPYKRHAMMARMVVVVLIIKRMALIMSHGHHAGSMSMPQHHRKTDIQSGRTSMPHHVLCPWLRPSAGMAL